MRKQQQTNNHNMLRYLLNDETLYRSREFGYQIPSGHNA